MNAQEQIEFLSDLVSRTYPTVSGDDEVETRLKDDGGLEVLYATDCEDPTHALDLYYVRQDDLGHVIKAVRILSDGITKDECLFYAHGHTLGCLLQH